MAFELRNISHTYPTAQGPLEALMPMTFAVNTGEFVSIIGPSGCGKSTLLTIASGLEEPTSGEILLDGKHLDGPGRERGMVFQNYTLYPWLTVIGNIRFSRDLRANQDFSRPVADVLRDLAYCDHLLEVVGLQRFASSYPRELSGGMRQRVAIARALANRPAVLLMDEPFGALDAQTREEMQELMLLLSRCEKTTVLFVTHDIEEALYLSNRVLVLSAAPGRIIEEIHVPFPASRPLDIKLDAEFLRIKRHVLELLRRGSRDRAERDALLARLRRASEGDDYKLTA